MQHALPRQFFRRIAAFVLGLLALFVLAMLGLTVVEKRTRALILEKESEEQAQILDAALERLGEPLRMFTTAYARRISFTQPGASLDAAEPPDVLRAGTRIFGATASWVIEADDRVRHAVAVGSAQVIPLPKLPAAAARKNPLRWYFILEGALWEVAGRRLDRNLRAPDQAPGWILAARRLGPEALTPPALPLDGKVALLPADAPPAPPAAMAITIDRKLAGFDGEPVALLRFTYTSADLEAIAEGERWRLALMSVFALAATAFMGLGLWRWVIRPAGILHRALSTDDAARLAPLEKAGSDYARLAAATREIIDSRAELRRALAGRAQLDRDLHDGVIQGIYAAGMALTQARARLEADPSAAARTLDEVHESLNRTIRELRGLIEGGEPAGAAQRSFGEVAASIVAQACAHQTGVRAEVRIDEALAARLPIPTRMQLLQFAREAVSNAARHARAAHLGLSLQPGEAGGLVLQIADDGVGFDPARVTAGRGLRNLALRAEELGGTLVIDAAPDRGTRVRLTLPVVVAAE